jgi:pyruvate dehydrogenase phosphatase regulatory subunit
LYSGVTVIENCAVTKVINQNGQIKAVETTCGIIECQHFVNCAGFWARNVGKLSEPHVKVKDIQER